MRIIGMAIVAALVAASVSADAKPAWETSPRWTCAEFERNSCERTGGCKSAPARAIVEIDFDKMIINNFTGGRTAVAMKSHYASRDKNEPGRTYFANDDGQMWVLLDRPKEGMLEDGDAYSVQSVSLYGPEKASLYYGECRPR